MKTCTKCKIQKPFNDFPIKVSNKDGYNYWCRDCYKAYFKKWRKDKKDRVLVDEGLYKKCPKCNTEKPVSEFSVMKHRSDGRNWECRECNTAYCKEWYGNNKDRAKEANRKYNEKNKALVKERKQIYEEKNKEKMREAKRIYLKAHPEQRAETMRKWSAKHRTTPKGILDSRISRAVCFVLNGQKGGRRWEDLVGYTVSDLMWHIEKNFCPGMTWENRDRWHIDHIIPKSAFNYTSAEDIDFKRCWALENLRPIWATENLEKHAKLERPFQPSLSIGA